MVPLEQSVGFGQSSEEFNTVQRRVSKRIQKLRTQRKAKRRLTALGLSQPLETVAIEPPSAPIRRIDFRLAELMQEKVKSFAETDPSQKLDALKTQITTVSNLFDILIISNDIDDSYCYQMEALEYLEFVTAPNQHQLLIQSQELNRFFLSPGKLQEGLAFENVSYLGGEISKQREEFLEQFVRLRREQVLKNQFDATRRFSPLQEEIIFLRKLQQENSNLIQPLLRNVRTRRSFEAPPTIPNELQMESLLTTLLTNNLLDAFSEEPGDELNYFREVENEQQGLREDSKPFLSRSQYLNFINRRKPKKGKCSKYALHSACTCCLSNKYDGFNPIQSCPECHFRMHRYCHRVVERCDKCRYKRLSQNSREHMSECAYCPNKGLMIKKIATNRFAHMLCLLVHESCTFRGDQVEFNISQSSMDPQICKFCKTFAKKWVKCGKCEDKMHVLCAFLNGCTIRPSPQTGPLLLQEAASGPIEDNGYFSERQYLDMTPDQGNFPAICSPIQMETIPASNQSEAFFAVTVDCCGHLDNPSTANKLLELSRWRQFKLNYCKMVFKQRHTLKDPKFNQANRNNSQLNANVGSGDNLDDSDDDECLSLGLELE